MSNGLRALVSASALLAASAAIALLALFAVAFSAGASVSAGEKAAVVAGMLDLVIGGTAVVSFWLLNRPLSGLARALSTGIFAACEFTLLALLFVATLVLLNR